MDDTPIADLFPHHRVFADIAGFTSWSSCREPTQVSSSSSDDFIAPLT
jgi:hypothetical protein